MIRYTNYTMLIVVFPDGTHPSWKQPTPPMRCSNRNGIGPIRTKCYVGWVALLV